MIARKGRVSSGLLLCPRSLLYHGSRVGATLGTGSHRAACFACRMSVVSPCTPSLRSHCTMEACWVEPFGPLGAYAWDPATNTDEGHQRPPSHTCSCVSSLSCVHPAAAVRRAAAHPDEHMGSPKCSSTSVRLPGRDAAALGGALWVGWCVWARGGMRHPGTGAHASWAHCAMRAGPSAPVPCVLHAHKAPMRPNPHTPVFSVAICGQGGLKMVLGLRADLCHMRLDKGQIACTIVP